MWSGSGDGRRPGLEAGDGPADGGLGDTEGRGGADEAAGFDDGGEHADAMEKTIVEANVRTMRGGHSFVFLGNEYTYIYL